MAYTKGITPRRLEDAITEYVDYCRSVRDLATNTCRSVESVLRMFCTSLKNPMVYNLERNTINRYIAERGKTLETSSLNQVKARLKPFLKWCEEEGYLQPNKFITRDLKQRQETQRADRRRLTADQFDALHDAAACSRDRMLTVMLTETLMRSSEVTSVQWGNVGLATGEIKFTRWKTRTEAVVPVSMVLDRELRAYRIWYERMIGRPAAGDDYVICSLKLNLTDRFTRDDAWHEPVVKSDDSIRLVPDRPMSRTHEVVQRQLVAIGFEGEPGRATLLRKEGGHTIRRSAARELLEALFRDPDLAQDEALLMVMSMLGHASIDMTMRYIGYNRDREKVMRTLKGKDWWAYTRSAAVIPISRAANDR